MCVALSAPANSTGQVVGIPAENDVTEHAPIDSEDDQEAHCRATNRLGGSSSRTQQRRVGQVMSGPDLIEGCLAELLLPISQSVGGSHG